MILTELITETSSKICSFLFGVYHQLLNSSVNAPLRLKGLLIGVWYAFLAINYLLIESLELYTIAKTTWISFHSVKTFLILISLIVYVCVAKCYQYRLRDEVVNERYDRESLWQINMMKPLVFHTPAITTARVQNIMLILRFNSPLELCYVLYSLIP